MVRMFETVDPKTGGKSDSRLAMRIGMLCFVLAFISGLVVFLHAYFFNDMIVDTTGIMFGGGTGALGGVAAYASNVISNRNKPYLETELEPFEQKANDYDI